MNVAKDVIVLGGLAFCAYLLYEILEPPIKKKSTNLLNRLVYK